MKLYWNQFRALLWKEYHEAKWVMLGGLVVFVGLLFFGIKYDGAGKHLHSASTQVYILFQMSFVLAFLIFLPLISRESEHNTFVCLRIKPLRAEMYTFFNWFAGIIYTVLLILIIHAIIIIVTMMLGFTSELSIIIRNHLLDIPLVIIASSLLFYFCSSFTSNRLRSFGVVLAIIPSFFLIADYAVRSDGFLHEIYLFFYVQPRLNLVLSASLLAILTLALVRLRMAHVVLNWPIYIGIVVLLFGGFFSLMNANISNYNVTAVAPQPDENEDAVFALIEKQLLGKGEKLFDDRHFVNQIRSETQTDSDFVTELGETHLDWISTGNGKHLIQLKGNQYIFGHNISMQYEDKKIAIEKAPELKFAMATYDQHLNINTTFEKPISELFEFEDKELNELVQDSRLFNDETIWEYTFTDDKGLLIGKAFDLHPMPMGMRGMFSDMDNKFRNPKFIATFTFEDEPVITPVETIEFHFDNPLLEPYTIECVEPGLFLLNETYLDYNQMPDLEIYGMKKVVDLLHGWLFQGSLVKDSKSFAFWYNDRILSLDISTPGKMVITLAHFPWNKIDKSPYQKNLNVYKAIVGDHLIYSYNIVGDEYYSIFDISNTINIKWVKDIKLPFTWKMSNWHFQGQLNVSEDYMIVQNSNAICIYRFDDNMNIEKAAKFGPDHDISIVNLSDQNIYSLFAFDHIVYDISPREISTKIVGMGNYELKKFIIGEQTNLPQPPEEPVLLGETEVYQTVRKNLMSLSSRMNDVIEKYLDESNDEAEEVQDDQQN